MSNVMNEPTVIFELRGHVGIISLNRPDKLNSFNQTMHQELIHHLDAALANHTCRVILMRGMGRGFSAGQDLGDPAIATQKNLQELVENSYNRLVLTIHRAKKPIIALVHGVAAGAGANIALACDIILLAQSAKFSQAFVKIGLTLDSGGSWFLPRVLGDKRAMAYALTGDAINAEQAYAWGMGYRIFNDETAFDDALEFCQRMAGGAVEAMAVIKESLHKSGKNSLAEQLQDEAALQGQLGQAFEFKEGVSAFMEKRTADFINQGAKNDKFCAYQRFTR